MSVVVKFRVDHVVTEEYGHGAYVKRTVRLFPVSDGSEEDQRFFEATPSGEIRLECANEAAVAQLIPGKSYYVTFAEAGELRE